MFLPINSQHQALPVQAQQLYNSSHTRSHNPLQIQYSELAKWEHVTIPNTGLGVY